MAGPTDDYFQLNAKEKCDRLMNAVHAIGKKLLLEVEKDISGEDNAAEPPAQRVNPA